MIGAELLAARAAGAAGAGANRESAVAPIRPSAARRDRRLTAPEVELPEAPKVPLSRTGLGASVRALSMRAQRGVAGSFAGKSSPTEPGASARTFAMRALPAVSASFAG